MEYLRSAFLRSSEMISAIHFRAWYFWEKGHGVHLMKKDKDNDGMTFFTGIILHLGDGLTGRVATPIRRILALMFEHPEMLTIIVRDSQRMNVMVMALSAVLL